MLLSLASETFLTLQIIVFLYADLKTNLMSLAWLWVVKKKITQCVSYNNFMSICFDVKNGVPQGPVLDLLLFPPYILLFDKCINSPIIISTVTLIKLSCIFP